MNFLSVLGLKGIAILIALLALGGFAGYKHYQLSHALAERDAAIAARDEAATARDKAIAVNQTNQATIAALQAEKESVSKALTNLEADRQKNAATIQLLTTAIRTAATDPANQTLLSPVLQQTVDSIQKQREERAQ